MKLFPPVTRGVGPRVALVLWSTAGMVSASARAAPGPDIPALLNVSCSNGRSACQSTTFRVIARQLPGLGLHITDDEPSALVKLMVRVVSNGCHVTSFPVVGPVRICKATLSMAFLTSEGERIVSSAVEADENDNGTIEEDPIVDGLAALTRNGEVAEMAAQERADREEQRRRALAAERARDDAAWTASRPAQCQEAATKDGCDGVAGYLRQRPRGAHAQEATELLAVARPRLAILVDNEAWGASNLERCRNPAGPADCSDVERYLQQHPSGVHGGEATELLAAARPRLEAIAARAQEQQIGLFEHASAQSAPDQLVESALRLRTLASQPAGSELATWRRVYSAFLRPATASGAEGWSALGRLLLRDHETGACLAKADDCPAWMDRTIVAAVFRGFTTAVTRALKESRTAVTRASAMRKTTEAGATALLRLVETGERQVSACTTLDWDAGVRSECEALRTADSHARDVLVAAGPALTRLRISRTASEWRRAFSRCRAVQSFYVQYRTLRFCDASCSQIKAKVDLESQALQRFTVADGLLDPATRQTVNQECQAAGCPSCP